MATHAKTGASSGPRRLAVYDDVVTLEDLCRGRTRLALIRDIAMGELSDRELALRITCDLSTIKAFRALFADEIVEVRSALAGQLAIDTAGLWIAKRSNRVMELQSDAEQLDKAMKWLAYGEGGNFSPMVVASREYDRLQRAKAALIAQAEGEYSLSEKRGIESETPITRYVLEMDDEIRELLS